MNREKARQVIKSVKTALEAAEIALDLPSTPDVDRQIAQALESLALALQTLAKS